MRRSSWGFLVALLAAGCSAAGGEPTPQDAPTVAPLRVWAHSLDLEWYARDAVERIEATSGVIIEVNVPETAEMSAPLFWSEQHSEKFTGYCPGHWAYIDVNAADPATTVLHELLHMAGAGHVGPGGGVMDSHLQPGAKISMLDLDTLCSSADCTVFAPEY